jgi:hypothetical protein
MPLAVHPDFAGRIWAAVQDRCGAGEQDEWARHSVETWRRLCHGGGRVSAYSDFEWSV